MPGQNDFFANYKEPNQTGIALIVASCALDGIEDTLTRVGADDALRQLYREMAAHNPDGLVYLLKKARDGNHISDAVLREKAAEAQVNRPVPLEVKLYLADHPRPPVRSAKGGRPPDLARNMRIAHAHSNVVEIAGLSPTRNEATGRKHPSAASIVTGLLERRGIRGRNGPLSEKRVAEIARKA